MAVTQDLLNKVSEYEQQGYSADEIVAGLQKSNNYPDVAQKIAIYANKGYGSDEILSGIKSSDATNQQSTNNMSDYDTFRAKFLASQAAPGYLPSTKFSKSTMGIASPADIDAVDQAKTKMKLSAIAAMPYVRPTVEGLGAVGGGLMAGTLGLPSGPGAVATGAAGAGLGYSTAKAGMDTLEEWLGGTPQAEALAKRSITDRALGSVYDTALGSTMEVGGQVLAPVVGGALIGAKNLATRSPVRNFNDVAKLLAARKMASAKTVHTPSLDNSLVSTRNPAVDVYARNADEAASLQQAIPGSNFTRGMMSDDPSILAMEQGLLLKSPEAASAARPKALKDGMLVNNRDAIQNYMNSQLPQGSMDDFIKELDAQIAARGQNSLTEANRLAGGNKEVLSANMQQLEQQVQRAMKAKADALYGQVPRGMEMDSTPLYSKLKELGGSVDPAFADPRNMPSAIIGKARNKLVPDEAMGQQFDYKSIYNQLTNNQGFSRGKTNKGFFTDSDFSRQLAEYFPSVKGYPKNEVLGALQDGMNGNNVGAFRQGILDDMAYDLGARGVPASTKQQQLALSEFLPADSTPITYEQLMQYNNNVTSALRQAKSTGNFSQAANLAEIKNSIQQTLKLAEETGQGQSVQALRDANKFYRESYVPTVRQGQFGKNSAVTSTGERQVADEISASKYLQPKDAGLAAANDFNRAFKGNVEAANTLRDYAKRDLYDHITGNGTEAPDLQKAQKWIADRMPALKKLGMDAEFDGLTGALKAQEDVAAFGKAIKSDPNVVLDSLLAAEGADKVAQTALKLKLMVRGNTAAEAGLKKAMADKMLQTAESAQIIGGNRIMTNAKFDQFDKKFGAAMGSIYTKSELQALANVRKAVEVESRLGRGLSGVNGSQTRDASDAFLSIFGRLAPFLDWTGRAARAVTEVLARTKVQTIQDYMVRATFDPVVAKELQLSLSKARYSKDIADILGKHINKVTAINASGSFRDNQN